MEGSSWILSIGAICFTAIIGAIVAWAWKRIAGSATAEDLADLREKYETDQKEIRAEITGIGSHFIDQFHKFGSDFTEKFTRFEDEIKAITREGIASGTEARKEIWKEIRDQGERVSSLEGYMSSTNGYKPRPRGGV